MVRLNIMAYLVLTKLFRKEMVERNSGKILQVASIGAKIPGPLEDKKQMLFHSKHSNGKKPFLF